MRKKLLSLFIASLMLSAAPCHAIIERITRWISPLGQEVNVFHDCHVDTIDYETTDTQHRAISARQSFKIVEDRRRSLLTSKMIYQKINDPQNPGFLAKLQCLNIYIKKIKPDTPINTDDCSHNDYEQSYHATPLCGLSTYPNTYNAEFRFALFNKQSEPKVHTELIDALTEIATYNDNDILNQYYDSMSNYIDIINTAESLCTENGLMYETKYIFLNAINARILHALYNHPDEPIIDIIAGGNHCVAVENIMISLGYTQAESVGIISDFISHQKKELALITTVNIEDALKVVLTTLPLNANEQSNENSESNNLQYAIKNWMISKIPVVLNNLQICKAKMSESWHTWWNK